MDLVNEFTVKVPIAKAWVTLTDLELIAPCLPGAQLTEVEGETYRGQVKVKVGPIVAQFKGEAHFVEKDDVNYRAVLRGKGRDTGGKGNADALITAQLTEDGPTSTKVVVTTDLNITGKVAQFGRGALADVSNKLLGQFVDNLETTVLNQPVAGAAATVAATVVADATAVSSVANTVDVAPVAAITDAVSVDASAAASTATAEAVKPTVRKIDSKEVEPLDLLDTAGSAMLKRFAPAIGAGLVVLLWLFRRRRH
jgi:uncharacterized protein